MVEVSYSLALSYSIARISRLATSYRWWLRSAFKIEVSIAFMIAVIGVLGKTLKPMGLSLPTH